MLRRLTETSSLPLTLAVQAVALSIAAFLFSSNPSSDPSYGKGTAASATHDRSSVAQYGIPRDLRREQLPVPKFPRFEDPKDRPEAAPQPDPASPKAPIAEGPKLASLRVESVALAALVSLDSPTPIPDAPDQLGFQSIGGSSGRTWLGGSQRTGGGAGGFPGPGDSGDDGSGWGGTGIGGSGHGAGGSCPEPGGTIGRPFGGGRGGSGGTVGRPGGPTAGAGTGGGGGERGRPVDGRGPGNGPRKGGTKR